MPIDHFPQKGDRFFRTGAGRLNTIIWSDSNARRSQILHGYLAAAEAVALKALDGSDHSDLLVFPLVYLYRHVFEFSLKTVIETGGGVALVKPNYSAHRLTVLWSACLEVLRHLQLDDIGVEGRVRKLLREFDHVDDGSYSFRYHTDTAGNAVAIPTEFDLVGFVQTADRLAAYFDYIVAEVGDRVSYCLEDRG